MRSCIYVTLGIFLGNAVLYGAMWIILDNLPAESVNSAHQP
jgi:hypothetical protein